MITQITIAFLSYFIAHVGLLQKRQFHGLTKTIKLK